MKAIADRCFVQGVSRRLKMGSLNLSLLFNKVLGLTLQPCNGTLSTVGPLLKSLRLLEEFWRMAELILASAD